MTVLKEILKEAENQEFTSEDENLIKKEMIKFILTKKPSDLTDAARKDGALSDHDGDWFDVTNRNKVAFNWRNKTYPLYIFVKYFMSKDIFDRYAEWDKKNRGELIWVDN